MSMAHAMKKADFLALVSGMKSPRVKREHIQVFVFDDKPEVGISIPVVVYCASSFREESYYSAQNQLCRYNKWLKEVNA